MIKGIHSFRTKEGGKQQIKDEKANTELRKLEKMSDPERWEYGIFEKQQDIDYFQKLDNDTLFNEERERQ